MHGNEKFRELIDRSFVEEVSESERHLIEDHIRDCGGCRSYLELTARTISGLRQFTFTRDPDSSTRVRQLLARHIEKNRLQKVRLKIWAVFALSLSLSIAGSALLYQLAKFLTTPTSVDSAQLLAGVVVFWLLPSFCSAVGLLAAPGRGRGIA